MHWQNLDAFWAMGGYGFYVWGSFGLTAGCIAAELWVLSSRRRGLTHGDHA